VLVSPSQTTTYLLVATNSAGTATAFTTVTMVIPEAFVWRKNLIYGFGQLICEDSSSGRIYLQGDHLGSPSVLTNAAGTVIGRQKSLPFGERMVGAGEKSFRRFTSHEDGAQLPVYMQARMYLPTYGRFAQVDPAYDHSNDGLNLYSYVSNQPTTQTDPDGMRDVESGGGGKPSNWAYPQLEARYGEGSDYIPGTVQIWIVKGGGTGFFGPPHQDFVSKEYPAAGSTFTQPPQTGANSEIAAMSGFNPSAFKDAGKTDINADNIASLVYDLKLDLINGVNGLVSQVINNDVQLVFQVGALVGAYGQFVAVPQNGKIYAVITIDTSKLSGSLTALAGVVAHELKHASDFNNVYGRDFARWDAAGKSALAASIDIRRFGIELKNFSGSRSSATYSQIYKNYYDSISRYSNNPLEASALATWRTIQGEYGAQ
jgi:RHS repeat-associated protein